MTPSHWILTSDGQDHHISGTSVLLPGNTPRIEVIAHSLAQINRFTGHASRPYSVAEHSLLVCEIVKGMGLDCHAQRAALMHDTHEAYTGDVATPIKAVLGVDWLAFENVHARMLRHAFHMQCAHVAYHQRIKEADLIALATERRDLMRFDPARNLPWPALDTPGAQVHPLEDVALNSPERTAMSWRHHRDAFIDRFTHLDASCSFDANTTEPTATP